MPHHYWGWKFIHEKFETLFHYLAPECNWQPFKIPPKRVYYGHREAYKITVAWWPPQKVTLQYFYWSSQINFWSVLYHWYFFPPLMVTKTRLVKDDDVSRLEQTWAWGHQWSSENRQIFNGLAMWQERMRMTGLVTLTILNWKIKCPWGDQERHGMMSGGRT